jgi:hypothetical protein
LPVSSGGLGVRLASDFALSAAGSCSLTLRLLLNRLHTASDLQDALYITACLKRQTRCNAVAPDTARCGIQKAWDVPLVNRKLEDVMSAAQTQAGRPGLLRLLHLTLVISCRYSSMLGGRHTTRRYVAAPRCHSSNRRQDMSAAFVRLWRAG